MQDKRYQGADPDLKQQWVGLPGACALDAVPVPCTGVTPAQEVCSVSCSVVLGTPLPIGVFRKGEGSFSCHQVGEGAAGI